MKYHIIKGSLNNPSALARFQAMENQASQRRGYPKETKPGKQRTERWAEPSIKNAGGDIAFPVAPEDEPFLSAAEVRALVDASWLYANGFFKMPWETSPGVTLPPRTAWASAVQTLRELPKGMRLEQGANWKAWAVGAAAAGGLAYLAWHYLA